MNSFNDSAGGYNKEEVNQFIDYVIKKTENNILTIKQQKDEIARLNEENLNLKKIVREMESNPKDNLKDKSLELVQKEANLIIQEAKDNASKIVNDALLKAKEIEYQKDHLNKTIHLCKKNLRMTLNKQLEMLDDIEIL